jgi:ATP-dependent Clp protease ATP-binding subunit ClpA
MFSKELEQSLKESQDLAVSYQHEFITPEHILYCLLNDPAIVSIIQDLDGNIDLLKGELEEYFKNDLQPIPNRGLTPSLTLGAQSMIQIANFHAQSQGKEILESKSLLISLFRLEESHAVYFLHSQGIDRIDLIRYITHGTKKKNNPSSSKSEDESQSSSSEKELVVYQDLTQDAREGKIDPVIGREDEIERSIHILSRKKKNNPLFVGDAGVGKTAIVEGIAIRIAKGNVPKSLLSKRILSLDMGSLVSGTRFRGDFEEKLQEIIEKSSKDPDVILFIDEIHTLIGAGATSGGSLDASNILKPHLANGSLRCIGATTFQEYKRVFEKDQALSRRFGKIQVEEPSPEDSYLILKGLQDSYEKFHSIKYNDKSIRECVDLSIRWIPDRRLPDKAIDLMDEAGALVKIRKERNQDESIEVIPKDVEKIIEKIARIPSKTITKSRKNHLLSLESNLQKSIFGQDLAVRSVVEAIQYHASGLSEKDKPIGSFLFAGPTGVGKTELAKSLAKELNIEFIRFDMSEYRERFNASRLIGSPPGYVGYDQGGQLTDAIMKHPHSVLLLDEIEKADESIYDLLLQVMDHATLTDSQGRKVDFRNVILIMTTNSGAREKSMGLLGFEKDEKDDRSQKAIEKTFSPEFRNRLTSMIEFEPLQKVNVRRVLLKFLNEFNERLSQMKKSITWEEPVLEYLEQKGYNPEMGARPLKKTIDDLLAKPFSKKSLELPKVKNWKATWNEDRIEILPSSV